MSRPPVYLATVCLERNRWGSRQPSYLVSGWLERLAADGFDGIELWENHYHAADKDERARLREAQDFVAVLNTYAGFSDRPAEADDRRRAAEAAKQLECSAIKYNVGADPGRLDEYRRNVVAWADLLPPTCRLWCECHPGTVLEVPDRAAEFLADLDSTRFGAIAHVNGDIKTLERWMTAVGPRVQHLHLQLRELEQAMPEGRSRLGGCTDWLRSQGYRGTASIEFTRGIGPAEQIEAIYAQAVSDLRAFRGQWELT